tara:strand:+ start:59 stop:637 length:579 start_codon:yes stop_codon:yes gene_type:complete
MTISIDQLKQEIVKEMTRLSNQLDALEGVTGDPVIHEYKPEIIEAPKPMGSRLREKALRLDNRKRRISTPKKKREHPPRYYLNEQYRGMTVSGATLLAAARMGDEAFTATDIGKKIYDYRGVERVSRMHSVIGSSLTSDPRCVRVDRGRYMWDDGMRMAGTHDKKLEQLIDSKTDSPENFQEIVVEEVPYNL